jgi:hypothetical protein
MVDTRRPESNPAPGSAIGTFAAGALGGSRKGLNRQPEGFPVALRPTRPKAQIHLDAQIARAPGWPPIRWGGRELIGFRLFGSKRPKVAVRRLRGWCPARPALRRPGRTEGGATDLAHSLFYGHRTAGQQGNQLIPNPLLLQRVGPFDIHRHGEHDPVGNLGHLQQTDPPAGSVPMGSPLFASRRQRLGAGLGLALGAASNLPVTTLPVASHGAGGALGPAYMAKRPGDVISGHVPAAACSSPLGPGVSARGSANIATCSMLPETIPGGTLG